jgi:hypothetical protein
MPSVLDMLSKITFRRNHYAYRLHSANPLIDADAEETNVRDAFSTPLSCAMPCIPSHAPECLLPQIVHSIASIFQACQLALSNIL